MAVDNSGVFDAEALEDSGWLQELLEALLDAIRGLVCRRAHKREVTQKARDLDLHPLIARVDAQLRQVPRKAADGRRIRAAVVVDDDDQVGWLQMRDLIECLVRHAAGQRAVADDSDHETIRPFPQPRFRDAERVAQRSRRMAVLDQVVLGFFARRIAGQAARLTKSGEVSRAPRDDLVDVRLMPGVPDDRVLGAVEHTVEGECQLDDPEVWREMAAGPGRLFDEKVADLGGELRELRLVEAAEVRWRVDRLEECHSVLNARSSNCVAVGRSTRSPVWPVGP